MHTTHFSRLSTAGLSIIAASFAASVAAAQVTMSGGDVTTYSQKHLVNHLIVGDSMEIAMGQLAASRTQNAAVRDFANQLVADHKAHLDSLLKLAGNANVGREANPSDTSVKHDASVFTSLQGMAADSGFDRAFVQTQIQHHQQAIAELKTLGSSATDPALKQDITATLPVLQKHLSTAQQLAAQLGKPGAGDSTAVTGNKPPVSKPPVAKPPV